MRLTSLLVVLTAIMVTTGPALAQRSPAFRAGTSEGVVTAVPGGSGFDVYALGFERLVLRSHGLQAGTVRSERYEALAFRATQLTAAPAGEFRGVRPALLTASAEGTGEWAVSTPTGSVTATDQFVPQSVSAVEAVEVVPEPEVIILLASGLLALGAVAYFRGLGA